jgi:hypothetical protein
VLRRQTDGYCILPGEGPQNKRTSIAVRIPRHSQSRSACAAFLLCPSGIPPERKEAQSRQHLRSTQPIVHLPQVRLRQDTPVVHGFLDCFLTPRALVGLASRRQFAA